MHKSENGEYKFFCDICKKDITGRTYNLNLGDKEHELCEKHHQMVHRIAFGIVEAILLDEIK